MYKIKVLTITAAVLVILLLFFLKTNPSPRLQPVSILQFATFVKETGYITDAEKYGWSIVQKNVHSFITVKGANWRKPDGRTKPANKDLPVTQVSYNDALAYCKWSNTRLPTYEEYWQFSKYDTRKVVFNNNALISSVFAVNVVGNVWDITSTTQKKSVRLAGGSLFCSPHICHGTQKDRLLLVDKETGNIHIGFAVISTK
ncbi:MAG: SUMF1/EgtB/PvdO family nonheme iron enzyme [Spirochaetota bacterium]